MGKLKQPPGTQHPHRREFLGRRAWVNSPLHYLILEVQRSKSLSDYDLFHLKRIIRTYASTPLTIEQEIMVAAAIVAYKEMLRSRKVLDEATPNTREYRMSSAAFNKHAANYKRCLGIPAVNLKRTAETRGRKSMWEQTVPRTEPSDPDVEAV